MTAHSAKGLEFPVVFIVGLEDGLFPHSRSLADASDIEDEGRRCHVAMTRAEKYLYVTHAVKRRVYGEELASEPSQFLNEMPLELIEDISRGRSWLSFARGSKAREQAAGSLAYEYDKSSEGEYVEVPSHCGSTGRVSAKRPGKICPGKTYDSVESIEEFFRKRAARMGGGGSSTRSAQSGSPTEVEAVRKSPEPANQSSPSSVNPEKDVRAPIAQDFVPGSHVLPSQYGRGLVLRREGSRPATQLTLTFPATAPTKLAS